MYEICDVKLLEMSS